MKKWSLFWALVLLVSGESVAGNISGAIRGTLTVDNSPYIVTGDLSVSQFDTLLIEPGVVLKFYPNVSFKIRGRLRAKGTPNDSIYFLANLPEQKPGNWEGIYLEGASNESVIEFARISGATIGLTITNSSPGIRNSLIDGNLNGIDCKQKAAPDIKFNLIKYNLNAGIRVIDSSPLIYRNQIYFNCETEIESAVNFNSGASGRLQNNIIAFNATSGIDCQGLSAPEIFHNTLVGNLYGITISNSVPNINGNIIYENAYGLMVEDTCGSISYNDIYGNTFLDLYGTPDSVGVLALTNANGDSVDQFFNLFKNPELSNAYSFRFYPREFSPVIDAGDPANPAGLIFLGGAPDIGAIEFTEGLPVELVDLSFDGSKLHWTTASESENFGFNIWLATVSDMTDKRRLAFVAGRGTTSETSSYSMALADLAPGTYFIQLEQIDLNGKSTFSKVLEIEIREASRNSRPVVANPYPNPFNGAVQFSWINTEASPVSLRIFNALGQLVAEPVVGASLPAGKQIVVWDGRNRSGQKIPSGIYYGFLQIGRYSYRFPLLHVQ